MVDNADIIAAAHARKEAAIDADRENRVAAFDDMEKVSGRQWEESVRSEREASNRPCPTHNRLASFVRQVTGDIRRLDPALRIIPGDDDAAEDVAEVIAGMIRQIEYACDASSVYEQAAENAAQCGMGAFRILTEYEHERSFNQVCKIKHIPNPFSVYWDPKSKMPTREDAEFCFIDEVMDQEDYKKMYPKAEVNDVTTDGITDHTQLWTEGSTITVSEYFWKERTEKTIGLLADGTVIEDPKAIHNTVATRKTEDVQVMWAKVNGAEVLEGPKEMPCMHIPVVAVMGEEIAVGDDVVRTSVIRFAKDGQIAYNWASAASLEIIAIQPKAPYLVTPKQIAGLESLWAQANDDNRPYLPYNPDEKAASAPMRVPPPVSSQGLGNELMKAAEDMKATTGIFDAGIGAQSNETSGVAIRQRQMESDVSTSIYTDNLAKAINQCGRILVDMIPKVYDTMRTVPIVSDDDAEDRVTVNAMRIGDNFQPEYVNNLSQGRYDVRVTVGPNYSTRRQETAESMMQFVQAFPQAATVAGDLIAKSMDWPGAEKIADRLRKTLPPGMINPEDLPEEEQQQMAAQMQQAQAMQAQQMQMQEAMAQAEIRSKVAGAAEDEAGAQRAQADAAKTQMETAVMAGEMNEALQAAAQRGAILALQQAGLLPVQ